MPALYTVGTPEPAPSSGLVPRLGIHDEALLPALTGLGLGLVARTAAQHVAHPEFAGAARAKGLELLVDPDCWRNQFPPEERPTRFADVGYAFGRAFDPDVPLLSREQERSYVRAAFELQQRAGASPLVPPYHLSGGPASPSRSLDLRLATLASEQLPQLARSGGRLVIGIALAPETLMEPAARAWLAARYASIHNRFLVKVDGLCDTSTRDEIRAVCEFLAGLRETGAKEILLGGGKNLAWALVGAGLVDRAIVGLNEGEIWRFEAAATDEVRARVIFHRTAFRSVAPECPSETGRERAVKLFDLYPCGCDHHDVGIPAKTRARKLHTLRLRAADYAALTADVAANERLLKQRIRKSDSIALELGYPKIRRSLPIPYTVAAASRRRIARQRLGF